MRESGSVPAAQNESHGQGASCAYVLHQLIHEVDLDVMSRLLHFWLDSGTTLILGAALLPVGPDLTIQQLRSLRNASITPTNICAQIFERTSLPLAYNEDNSFSKFVHDVFEDVRSEAIILLLVALGRAVTDISFFPPLYKTRAERHALQLLFLKHAEQFLEAALALDCANEMLLICQFETWILYTMIKGDQSE